MELYMNDLDLLSRSQGSILSIYGITLNMYTLLVGRGVFRALPGYFQTLWDCTSSAPESCLNPDCSVVAYHAYANIMTCINCKYTDWKSIPGGSCVY